jgi:hypothetical protein
VLLHKIGVRPDAILFADTGNDDAEKPETYEHVGIMSSWCESVGFPSITTVRRDCDPDRQSRDDKYETLEQECHVKKCLPSIAYYRRSCSIKWKHDPQDKWVNNWEEVAEFRASGGKIIKAIFYDASEPGRAKHFENKQYQYWHPLIDYDWGPEECAIALRLMGLPVPPKSSCFFCPEMTPREVFDLQNRHPELLERALKMESNANLHSIKGLGKHEYSWRELIDGRVPLDVIERANRSGRAGCVCTDE